LVVAVAVADVQELMEADNLVDQAEAVITIIPLLVFV
jgi:hypothetical protein